MFEILTFWRVLIILNAVLGPLLLRKTLKKLEKHANLDEETAKKFPQWRRYDNKNWSSWTLYLGAATIMLPRMLLYTFIIVCGSPYSMLCFLGRTIKKGDCI